MSQNYPLSLLKMVATEVGDQRVYDAAKAFISYVDQKKPQNPHTVHTVNAYLKERRPMMIHLAPIPRR
jgi:hypothetical protein